MRYNNYLSIIVVVLAFAALTGAVAYSTIQIRADIERLSIERTTTLQSVLQSLKDIDDRVAKLKHGR